MFEIRAAAREEYPLALQFYDDLTDVMEGAPYPPGWKKRVYPSEDFLKSSIACGELYLGWLDGSPAAAMVVNRAAAEGYEKAPWRVEALPGQVAVLHALGVLPCHQGRGLARRMVEYAANFCRARGDRALRLDVLASNLPAVRLYPGLGFWRVGTARLFYEDTGLTDFYLYEKAL